MTVHISRRLSVGLGVAFGAVSLVAGLAGCSGSSSKASPSSVSSVSAASTSSAVTSTVPSTAPSTSRSASVPPTHASSTRATTAPGTSTAPGATSSVPGTPNVQSTVPSVRRTTRPAVAPTRPAQFDGNVSVRLTATRSYNATARGPGEISGPAVAFTLTLTNNSARTVSVASSNVTADYGTNHTPANPLSESPSKPWTGSVRSKGSISGVYCFSIPTDQHARVTLTISYDPTRQVVVISGPIS